MNPLSQPRYIRKLPATLTWRRPTALWLWSLIFLFLVTTLPLIAQGGRWPVTIFFSNGLVLVAMSFVIIHHFFGFVHRVDQEDFYFSLPAGRLTLFTRLNLGALAYLTGPSLAVMGLNTLLAESLSPVLPEWDFYVLSTADLWSG